MFANNTWTSKYSTFIHGSSGGDSNFWCENDALGGNITLRSTFDTMNHGSFTPGDDPPLVLNSIFYNWNIADNGITY